jgi:hypothetical protein
MKSNRRPVTFFIVVEAFQEIEKFVSVPPEDALNLGRLLGICDEHLLNWNVQ